MYRIPKDGKVILAIRNVLARYRNVSSQRRFKELVEKELNQGKEEFHVSGVRIRKLAIVSGIAHIEVHTRGDGVKKHDNNCPACGTELNKFENMTVYGDTVTLGYVCPSCTYSTGRERREPSRYIFFKKEEMILWKPKRMTTGSSC